MLDSKDTRRAAAGRSGGVFTLTESDAGTPIYMYVSGYGSSAGYCEAARDATGHCNSNFQPVSNDNGKRGKSRDRSKVQESSSFQFDEHRAPPMKSMPGSKAQYQHFKDCETTVSASPNEGSYHKNISCTFGDRSTSIAANPPRKSHPGDQRHESAKRQPSPVSVNVNEYNKPVVTASDFLPLYPDRGFESDDREFEDGYFSTDEEYSLAEEALHDIYMPFGFDQEKFGHNDTAKEHTLPDNKPTSINVTQGKAKRDMRNHYEVLCVPVHCTDKLITARARLLMSALHPDKVSTRTAEQKKKDAQEFARVSLAKTELLDAELRVLHNIEVASGLWDGVPNT